MPKAWQLDARPCGSLEITGIGVFSESAALGRIGYANLWAESQRIDDVSAGV